MGRREWVKDRKGIDRLIGWRNGLLTLGCFYFDCYFVRNNLFIFYSVWCGLGRLYDKAGPFL